jgi:hypothetical protein
MPQKQGRGAMKYIFMLLAVLLVVGSLAILPIYAEEGDGGDEYGEPLQ